MASEPMTIPIYGEDPATPLDLLIVGGGPCGTAAAFRCKELGLRALVIDREGPLSILGDWAAASKRSVSPDYGADELAFPDGGELVRSLVYETSAPEVLQERWMAVYQEHEVPFRAGVELVGLSDHSTEVFAVHVQVDQRRRHTLYARHVLLAIGKSTNPSLDILGDPAGIRFKLGKASEYLHQPACVIGGGVSAAEAVIAIAKEKAEAEDPCPVFWVNRRRDIRRIAQSRDLEPEFFHAWTTGVIRYLPSSRPLSIITDDDGNEVLAVRAERRTAAHEPPQITCYEFAKPFVLACIGARRDDELLDRIGIRSHPDPNDAARDGLLAMSPICESERERVFLGGGLLHDQHLVLADPSKPRTPRTTKDSETQFPLAMQHGVTVAEAVRLLGQGASRAEIIEQLTRRTERPPADDAVTVRSAPPPSPPDLAPRARFTMRDEEGGLLERRELHMVPTREHTIHTIGAVATGSTDWVVTGHPGVQPQHCQVVVRADRCQVAPATPAARVFLRFRGARSLPVGSVLQVGDQRLEIVRSGDELLLRHHDRNGMHVQDLVVPAREIGVGRQHLDEGDTFISRSHFRVSRSGGDVRLRDSSRNGTFLEVRRPTLLEPGDQFWLDDLCFEFDGIATPTQAETAVAAPGKEAVPRTAPDGRASIEVLGRRLSTRYVPPADSSDAPQEFVGEPCVLRVAELHGLAARGKKRVTTDSPIAYSCWKGKREEDGPNNGNQCGLCAVVVDADPGAELSPKGEAERDTLSGISTEHWPGLEAMVEREGCRLACQLVVHKGHVRLRAASELSS